MNNKIVVLFYYITNYINFNIFVSQIGQKLLYFYFHAKIILGEYNMKYNKIKDLREDHDYSQNFVSNYLGVKRSTYANWENGDNLIPLEIVDKLSLLYNTTLAFLLGLSNTKFNGKINSMNYENILIRLNLIKKENKLSYQKLANYIGVSRSNCYKYYKGIYKIPTHILILLCKFNNVDMDELCSKIDLK